MGLTCGGAPMGGGGASIWAGGDARRRGLVELGISGELEVNERGRDPPVSGRAVIPGGSVQTAGGKLCVTYMWAHVVVPPAIHAKPPAVNCTGISASSFLSAFSAFSFSFCIFFSFCIKEIREIIKAHLNPTCH